GESLVRARGAGSGRLQVEAFRELEQEPVRLVDGRLISSDLGDLETRSWWFRVEKRERALVLEAAGRHLADLRLWRDGSWLVGDEPRAEVIEPVPGRPLRLLRLSSTLPPGLYRLSAYGGPSLDWAEDDGTRPLHVRSGVPRAPEAARRRVELSPFGFDRWLVPGAANYFRLETAGAAGPAGERTSLEVAPWDEKRPFPSPEASASITREARLPVAELMPGSSDRARVLTVRGRAGEALVLQHFRSSDGYRLGGSPGTYWISTIFSGSPGDAAPATAVLASKGAGRRAATLDPRAVRLERGSRWRASFNLTSRATFFVRAEVAGSFDIRAEGEATARLRLEPFFAPGTRPRNYRSPQFRDDGGEWALEAGVLYFLTVEPRRPGIVTLSARAAQPDPPASADSSLPPEAVFQPVTVESRSSYTVYSTARPGGFGGVVARRLPIDLREALPLVAAEGDGAPLSLPCRSEEAGVVQAVAENGSLLELSADGGAWRSSLQLEAGRELTLRIRPPEGLELPVAYSLQLAPERLETDAPLPMMAPESLRTPEFPRLEAGAERRLELGRESRETFLLRASRPALYRLESTGLLDTSGTVRTRVQPELETRTGGGSGRNFAVARYLGPGDYQLTVRSRGRSRGPLGVRLSESPVQDGGDLRP
ncbi:MAG: hypothetical protein AAF725_26270, partial [Acidobacteriota bacterium]